MRRQVREGLSRFNNLRLPSQFIYVAYEPLWAISTGAEREECSPETAAHRIAYIKEQLLHLGYAVSAKYLYGGSVTRKNAAQYLNNNDIDGLLVGAASVNAEELKNIWHLASK